MRPADQTTAGHDGDEIAALVQFWDDLDHGLDDAPAELDPALAVTVRRIRALHAGSAPADARDRVWQRLQGGDAVESAAPIVVAPPSSNGRTPLNGHVPPAAKPIAMTRRRWSVANLAAAAVLLVALGLGLRVLLSDRNDQPTTQPAAVVITGEPTPVSITVAPKLLVSAAILFDELPHGAVQASLVAKTIPPGDSTSWTTPQNVRMFAVLSGEATIRAQSMLRVQRAGLVGTWEDYGADAQIDLRPGDVVLQVRPAPVEIANLGSDPAEVLSWSVAPSDSSEDPATNSDVAGRATTGTGTIPSVDNNGGMLQLRRLDLPPSAIIAPSDGAFVELAMAPVENAAGTPQPASALARSDDGSLRNTGSTNVTVYVVTLIPREP